MNSLRVGLFLSLFSTLINMFALMNIDTNNELVILFVAVVIFMDIFFIPMLIILTIVYLADLWDGKQSSK